MRLEKPGARRIEAREDGLETARLDEIVPRPARKKGRNAGGSVDFASGKTLGAFATLVDGGECPISVSQIGLAPGT